MRIKHAEVYGSTMGRRRMVFSLAPSEGNSLTVVMFGKEILSGFLARAQTPNPAVKTLFTVVLPNNDPALPAGSGYATGRIMPTGQVIISGKLADGTKLSWGSTLAAVGATRLIPLYSEPLRGGACGGHFVATGTSPAFAGSFRWIRPRAARATLPYPNGFAGDLSGLMDVYTIPARGVFPVDFGVDLSGTIQVAGPTIATTASTMNIVGPRIVSTAPLLSFAINRNTGIFTGKIKAGTRTVVFNGAVLQSIKGGSGFFTLDKQSGVAAFAAD